MLFFQMIPQLGPALKLPNWETGLYLFLYCDILPQKTCLNAFLPMIPQLGPALKLPNWETECSPNTGLAAGSLVSMWKEYTFQKIANICCLILYRVSIGNIYCLFFLVC